MGWLIALAVLVAIGCIPVGVSAKYSQDGPVIKLIVGPLRKVLNAKKDKPSKEKAKKEKPAKKKTADPAKEKKGGSILDFYPLLDPIWEMLKFCRRRLRVKRLELKVILAGDDPCDLAVNYGRACGALGALEPQLDRFFVIRKKDMQIECDFEASQTLIWARADLTITVGRLLHIGFYHGLRILKRLLNILKSRKGGALE